MSYDWSAVNWHLLHSDDFDTYASQGDFEAAYPNPISGSTPAYPDWGLTNGPDGQPGLHGYNHGANPVLSPGKIVVPSGRFAKMTARVSNTDFTAPPGGGLFALWYSEDPSTGAVASADTEGLQDGKLYGGGWTIDPPSIIPIFAVGGVPSFPRGGPPIDLEMWVAFSTKFLSSPGTWHSNADGAFELFVDSVSVYSYEGVVSNRHNSTNGFPWWNVFGFAPFGHMAVLRVYDSTSESVIPLANSSECCASSALGATEGSGVPPPGAGVERPVLLSAAWGGRCEGGGAVALLADLTDAEDWSDS